MSEEARWLKAMHLLVLCNVVWMMIHWWYLKGYDGGWLCTGRNSDTGFLPLFPTCPPERPYAGMIRMWLPIIGWLASATIPIWRYGVGRNEGDWMPGWTPGCLLWLVLAVLVPFHIGILILLLLPPAYGWSGVILMSLVGGYVWMVVKGTYPWFRPW